MFHNELMTAHAQAMTKERLREVEHLRAARQARAEERARRREERDRARPANGGRRRGRFGRAA